MATKKTSKTKNTKPAKTTPGSSLLHFADHDSQESSDLKYGAQSNSCAAIVKAGPVVAKDHSYSGDWSPETD